MALREGSDEKSRHTNKSAAGRAAERSYSQRGPRWEYDYEVPAQGGGIQRSSVQHSLTDRVPGHGPHWEAGAVKTGNRVDSLGRPRLVSQKVKVDE